MVPERLELPRGLVRQRPPAYSAVKVDGERAYARARRGEAVATREREVTVHDARELWREGDRVGLRFVCSSGTYVRSLVADLGDAYCLELRRLAIGPFEVAGAWPGEGTPVLVDIASAWARFGETIELASGGGRGCGAGPGDPCARRGRAGAAASTARAARWQSHASATARCASRSVSPP